MGPFGSRPFAAGGAWLLAQAARNVRNDWSPLETTSIFADLATFAAYAVIPLLILYFLLRRRHVHFSRVWFLLLAYLIVGGIAHVLTAFGEPAESWAIAMKVVLAFISWIWV